MRRVFVILTAASSLAVTTRAADPVRSAPGIVVIAEEIGSGAGQSTAPRLANIGSFNAAISTPLTAASQAFCKQGFAGGLFEVQSLAASATPPSVSETSTAQLGAIAFLDDDTSLAPKPSEANWAAQTGPIAAINPFGVLTPAPVYQDAPATAQGSYLGKSAVVSLTVLDTNPDNFGSYAGDGLNDLWQVQTFGTNNASGLASADPDGDGQNNTFEYVAATSPTNVLSRFVFRMMANASQHSVAFSPRFPSRSYSVLYNTNLASGLFVPLTDFTNSDNGVERTVTDLSATNASRLYRVEIRLP